MARLNPSFAASFSLAAIWPTGRIAPDKATSPQITVSLGIKMPVSEEIRTAAAARSAAGSTMRKPPATFK